MYEHYPTFTTYHGSAIHFLQNYKISPIFQLWLFSEKMMINAEISSGLRLVIKLPSTSTSSF